MISNASQHRNFSVAQNAPLQTCPWYPLSLILNLTFWLCCQCQKYILVLFSSNCWQLVSCCHVVDITKYLLNETNNFLNRTLECIHKDFLFCPRLCQPRKNQYLSSIIFQVILVVMLSAYEGRKILGKVFKSY